MDKRFYLALKLNFYIDAFMYSIILLNQSINSCIMPPISFFLLSSYSLAKQFCSTVFVFFLFIYLFFYSLMYFYKGKHEHNLSCQSAQKLTF